jgi:hypothetical protein
MSACIARGAALLLVLGLCLPGRTAADEALWARLNAGGQVVLLRHATTTPGSGTHPAFAWTTV